MCLVIFVLQKLLYPSLTSARCFSLQKITCLQHIMYPNYYVCKYRLSKASVKVTLDHMKRLQQEAERLMSEKSQVSLPTD